MKLPEALPDTATDRQLRDYRLHKTLLWLAEFRVSSVPILAKLIGMSPKYESRTHRFFKSMIDSQLLVAGKHPLLYGETLFVAGPAAGDFLLIRGHTTPVYTDASLMTRIRTLYHDLSIQRVVLERLDNCAEVHGEFQLKLDERLSRYNRPDAIIVGHDGQRLAYEYEMTQKTRGRIYLGLQSHIMAMQHGLYDQAVLFFPTAALRAKYQQLAKPRLWPLYQKDQIHGSAQRLDGTFDPSKFAAKLHFTTENYYSDKPITPKSK